jgi:tripartite ATP-independent transporter DctP family solute receptor
MMKISRRRASALLLLGLVAFAATTADAADWVLNVNTALSEDDPIYDGLERFKTAVDEKSSGRLEIRIFPGSQLGSDEDMLEQARAGANVAVLVDGARLAPYAREFGILGAPYLIDDVEDLAKLSTTPLFAEWEKKLRDAAGLQVLSFNWFQGQRHLLTKKPVTQPADLAGVRMRTPGAPMWLETVRAMGATPTPMPWSDVYSGLQMGVIDAAEAQDPATYGSRLYEVITHITKTGHISLITGLIASAEWFESLPEDQRKILREEAFAAGTDASQKTIASLEHYEAEMKTKGVTIEEIDVTPFRQATADVYAKLDYADLRKAVEAALGR